MRMKKQFGVLKVLLASLLMIISCVSLADNFLRFSERDIAAIAKRIFVNETGGNPDAIAWWAPHENFASVGIGHFLWMPKGYEGPFEDSFSSFLWFSRTHHVTPPAWLLRNPRCPWRNRYEWLKGQHDPRMMSLKRFLLNTKDIQAQFIIYRFNYAMRAMLNAVPASVQRTLMVQVKRLMASPQGQYALVDYVNFKGTGVNEYQKGNTRAWGLLQVLQHMKNAQASPSAVITEFVTAAKQVLKQRVVARPQDRVFLVGWMKRIDSYSTN